MKDRSKTIPLEVLQEALDFHMAEAEKGKENSILESSARRHSIEKDTLMSLARTLNTKIPGLDLRFALKEEDKSS